MAMDAEAVAEVPLEPVVMARTPRRARLGQKADRLLAGGAAGQAVEVEAVDEAAREVGLGELAADQRGDIAHVRGERLLHPDLGGDQRVVQQVAPDLVGGVGEVVRRQQQARRADAVGREDDHVGRLEVPLAGDAVDIDGAGRPPVASCLDPQHARIGAQLDAGLQRLRPDRDRELAHRAARAAVADAAAVAGRPAVIVPRDHAGRHRPPVPAEPVERLAPAAAHAALIGSGGVG